MYRNNPENALTVTAQKTTPGLDPAASSTIMKTMDLDYRRLRMFTASSPEQDGEEPWPKTWSTSGMFRGWARNHLSRWLDEVEDEELGDFELFEARDQDTDSGNAVSCTS
ncbi:hypothetical protein NM208_g1753 [Fusarium decemcellulare]|uniref:Uncharacterized protein n=1 Tax=Fusarium decemcellulare TaxID=57161 RepID=A0ACC1SUY4_9HYPO|nr:hypothetical protein NM208_g1753 [Fusarium decemcellulare]